MLRPDRFQVPAPSYGVDLVLDELPELAAPTGVRLVARRGPVPPEVASRMGGRAFPGRFRLRVSDGPDALALAPAERLRRFCAAVAELCITAPPPLAIAWYPSLQWVDPEAFLDRRPGSPFGAQPLYGPVRVRIFDGWADTMGLAALGWPDLQRVSDDAPAEAARVLYTVADALLAGEPILHGSQVRVDDLSLRCAATPSLSGPWRRVWDLATPQGAQASQRA